MPGSQAVRDGPLEKWLGGGRGWGKKQKKIHPRENAKEKNSCKEEDKENKIHAEGRSSCDFYLIYKNWQCLLRIILIKNNLGALPQALLFYYY